MEDKADPQNTQVFAPWGDADQKSDCLEILYPHNKKILSNKLQDAIKIQTGIMKKNLALKQKSISLKIN